MKMYIHPTPNSNLGSFKESFSKLKEAVDLIPLFIKNDNLVYYPLHKLKNGRLMTYWKYQGLGRRFISDSNHNTLSSIDDLFEENIFVDELVKRVEHFEELLSKFHIQFKAGHSVAMAKLYTYGYLRLQGKLVFEYPKELGIESAHEEFVKLLKAVQMVENKLVQLLQNLIKDFNYSHNEFVKEVLSKYGGEQELQIAKTFALVDEETFDYNLDKIYRKLCPMFVVQETEKEQLELIFGGSIEEISPVKWVQSPNHLNYFLKGLKTRNKIANGNYFKLATNIFVDAYGNPFVNLKNNHSLPQHALDLDEIIDLF